MKTVKLLLGVSMIFLACSLAAQTNWPGYIDTSFTATCITNVAYNNTVRGILLEGDGKIVGVGDFANFVSTPNRSCENGIFRCNSNGVPDGTFNSPFTTFPSVQAIVAAGGKYVVAGSMYINSKQYTLARLNSNGGLDGTFSLTQTNPAGGSAVAYALGVDSLGRIVTVGTAFVTNATPTVKRVNSNGTVDGTFTPAAITEWFGLGLRALAIQPDNKILIGGLISTVGGVSRIGIARLNENGTRDDTFTSPFDGISSVAGIKLLTNGQMLVTGSLTTNGGAGLSLARLNENGSIDATFPPVLAGTLGSGPNGTALAIQADGKIIFTHGSGASRVSAGGVVDTSFAQGHGTIANGGYRCVALDANGRILVGTESASLNSATRRGLVRLFGGNASVPTPPTIDVQPTDQYAFAGGSATFNVGVSGSQPLIYNWNFGGANVGGAATVTFSGLVLGHSNTTIYCVITNQYGRATSSVVRLYVSPAPIAPTITTNPVSVAVSNPAPITAADLTEVNLRGKILHLHILGGAAPFPVTGDYDIVLAAGGNTYAIPAGGAMAASSGNWTFGPDLGINTVLTLDNSFPGGGGPVKVALLTDGTYEMYADGVVNNQNGTYALFNSDGTPAGPTVTFTVAANGTEPFTYTWLFNGSPLAPVPDVFAANAPVFTSGFSGANTATLTLNNVTTLNAGGYSALITNLAGRATSAVAVLTVNGFSGGVTDTAKPSLTITAPSSKLKTVGSNNVNFAGTARDNIALAAVQTSVNGGSFASANGLSNWTANVHLAPGTNTIRVRAADLLGNAVTNTRVLIYQPVIPLAGTYNGLFYDTNAPVHASAGGFSMILKSAGTFTGKVKIGTTSYSYSGKFGLDLTAQATVPRRGLSSLALSLRLVNGRLEGDVADGTNWTSFLAAYKSGAVGILAGKYTLRLPGTADPTNTPAGDTTSTLTLTSKGKLTGLGNMGDGATLRVLTSVAPGGQAPFYNPLYSGAGSFFGWMSFADTLNQDIVGTLYWTKPVSPGATYYPTGFSLTLFAAGSRFIKPPASTPALALTNGVVLLSGGNVGLLTIPITIGSDNKISGSNSLSLTISTLTGSVSGSFRDPVTNAKRTIKGVVLRDQNYGGGHFLGTDQSGAIFIGNLP